MESAKILVSKDRATRMVSAHVVCFFGTLRLGAETAIWTNDTKVTLGWG